MLFISGVFRRVQRRRFLFQSRHRDAFHFRQGIPASDTDNALFQSRHRDAFHFRIKERELHAQIGTAGFNLVIEMLFISGYT